MHLFCRSYPSITLQLFLPLWSLKELFIAQATLRNNIDRLTVLNQKRCKLLLKGLSETFKQTNL